MVRLGAHTSLREGGLILGFPNRLKSESIRRTEEVRHGCSDRLREAFERGQLRALAKTVKDAGQARRLLALTVIYDGGRRTEAARTGSVGLQIIRDWVLRFNARGPDGILGQAGWHMSAKPAIPDNITLLPLPPRSPELNPVENIWRFLRDNWLSNRIFESCEDIVALCCAAWNKLIERPWKVISIGMREWAYGFWSVQSGMSPCPCQSRCCGFSAPPARPSSPPNHRWYPMNHWGMIGGWAGRRGGQVEPSGQRSTRDKFRAIGVDRRSLSS